MKICVTCGNEFELKGFVNRDFCSPKCKIQSPKYKFYQYKYHAKRRGIKWSMTFEEFMMFWKKDCHYCGGKVESIGLDRVKNEIREYCVSNVVPCCFECNKAKRKKHVDEYRRKKKAEIRKELAESTEPA